MGLYFDRDAFFPKGTILADNEAVDTLESETISGANFGRSIYKNLMNGVSHMLPFVVAGGVLIAISFAVWGIYSFEHCIVHDLDQKNRFPKRQMK